MSCAFAKIVHEYFIWDIHLCCTMILCNDAVFCLISVWTETYFSLFP